MRLLMLLAALCAPALASPHGAVWPPVDPPEPPPLFKGRDPNNLKPGHPATGGGGPPMAPTGPLKPVGGPGTPLGGPGAPGGRGAASPGGDPSALDAWDEQGWETWWNFSGAAYLDVEATLAAAEVATGGDDFDLGRGESRGALSSRIADPAALAERVLPALIAVLEGEHSDDLLTAALMAVARIGRADHPELAPRALAAIQPLLAHGNQEVAETATLALALLQRDGVVDPLLALALDTPAGRALVGRGEVPYRTRAFAAYGLGLAGAASESNAERQTIAARLIDLLEAPEGATPDLQVAAVIALGLVPISLEASLPQREESAERGSHLHHVLSRRTQLDYLTRFLAPERPGSNTRATLVRAHAATSVARLLAGAPPGLRASVTPALLATLGERRDEDWRVQASAVLALGRIGRPTEEELDLEIQRVLVRAGRDGHAMVRRFSLIALARIGSRPELDASEVGTTPAIREHLMHQLARGRSLIKPWAALALGILGRGLTESGQPPDDAVNTALRTSAQTCKRPQMIGAYAIACGLRRDVEALPILLDRLAFFSDPRAKGYVIVGLGLLGEPQAIPPIAEVLHSSGYKPDLLRHAAVGLGLLGSPELVSDLLWLLSTAKGRSSQAAIAAALGRIGDPQAIEPLLELLADDRHLTDGARAFSAVALGQVCDDQALPWNLPIGAGLNYLATTPTLTGQGRGVLDIL